MCKANSSNDSFAAFQTSVLPPLLGAQCALALLGNGLSLWLCVSRLARPWHAGTVLTFGLTVSDLLYACSLPLLVAYYAGCKSWPFGEAACRAERFVFAFNLYGSILFVTLISLNRYLAIARPMFARNHVTPGRAWLACLSGWLLAAAATSPSLYYSQLLVRGGDGGGGGGGRVECLGSATDERLAGYLSYSLALAALGCALPFLVTVGCYMEILRAVRASRAVGTGERRKVLALALVVMALYGLSFLPYATLRNVNLYRRLHRLDRKAGGVYKAYQVSKALVTLNACLHPLLYAALPEHARALCHRHRRRQTPGPAYTAGTELQA